MSVLWQICSIFWKYTSLDYINRYMSVTVKLWKYILSGEKASPFLVRDDLPLVPLKQWLLCRKIIHFACTDTVEFLFSSWMRNVQIFEFHEKLKLLALAFLACVKRIMLRASRLFYILLNILSCNNTVKNLQLLIISAFCSGCHQIIHHFELKENPNYRLNIKW